MWMFVEDVLLGAAVQHQRPHSTDDEAIDWRQVSALLRGNRSAEQWKKRWEDIHNGEMYGYDQSQKKRGRPPANHPRKVAKSSNISKKQYKGDILSSDESFEEASEDTSDEAEEDGFEDNEESSDEGEWDESEDVTQHQNTTARSLIDIESNCLMLYRNSGHGLL